jgi:hypothetical protein
MSDLAADLPDYDLVLANAQPSTPPPKRIPTFCETSAAERIAEKTIRRLRN